MRVKQTGLLTLMISFFKMLRALDAKLLCRRINSLFSRLSSVPLLVSAR